MHGLCTRLFRNLGLKWEVALPHLLHELLHLLKRQLVRDADFLVELPRLQQRQWHPGLAR